MKNCTEAKVIATMLKDNPCEKVKGASLNGNGLVHSHPQMPTHVPTPI